MHEHTAHVRDRCAPKDFVQMTMNFLPLEEGGTSTGSFDCTEVVSIVLSVVDLTLDRSLVCDTKSLTVQKALGFYLQKELYHPSSPSQS